VTESDGMLNPTVTFHTLFVDFVYPVLLVKIGEYVLI